MKRILVLLATSFIYIYSNATVYTVNSTSDVNTGSGTSGTFRWCINQVNADAATPHTIQFNIAGSGVQTITLTSALPTLTQSNVTIDGYTQPGAAMGTFSTRVLLIKIIGNASGGFALTLDASNIIIRGFAMESITSSNGYGFLSVGVRTGTQAQNTYSNVKIQGNFFNVEADGSALTANTTTLGSGAQVYGYVVGGISTAKHVVIGVDGDGVDDDKEGNLSACSSNAASSTFDMRDVDSCTFAGNWIGIKPDGATLVNYLPAGNSGHTNFGIYIGNCVSTVIGTNGDGVSDILERNVIADGSVAVYVTYNYNSGNNPSLSGQPLRPYGNNMVTGNYVGTLANGTTATGRIPNGVALQAIGTYVGCNTAGVTNSTLRNVVTSTVSGSGIFELPHNNTTWNYVTSFIKGNYIGIGADGITAMPLAYALYSESALNSQIVSNVIGNATICAILNGHTGNSNYVNNGVLDSANVIGLLPDKVTPAHNGKGIWVDDGTNIKITQNTISNSDTAGIVIAAGFFSGVPTQGITVSQNSIWGNNGLGIDLAYTYTYGVTPNDGLESAVSSTTSPNLLMDYPIITAASLSGNNLIISGYVGSASGQALFAGSKVEFFIANNFPADQNGPIVVGDGLNVAHGEGQTYLGTTTTDANGNFSATIDVTGKGMNASTAITSTATDVSGNTSEFGPDYSNVILPLKLLSFNAAYNQSTVDISWTITDEENMLNYNIERSVDGKNFISINAQQASHSLLQKTYYFTDGSLPDAQKLYYRLRMEDINGTITYSNIAIVNVKTVEGNLQISPNPAKNFINLNFSSAETGDCLIDIINSEGARLLSYRKHVVAGQNRLLINEINNFPSGTYIIRLSNGTRLQYAKFVIE